MTHQLAEYLESLDRKRKAAILIVLDILCLPIVTPVTGARPALLSLLATVPLLAISSRWTRALVAGIWIATAALGLLA